MVHEDGYQQSSYRTDPIRHSHQDTCVSRRNVQVVHVETGNGEAAACNPERQRDDRRHSIFFRCRMGNHQEEESLHTETAAIEELPYIRRRQYSTLSNVIGQQSSQRHDHCHQ